MHVVLIKVMRCTLLLVITAAVAGVGGAEASANGSCDYAEDMSALSAKARDAESRTAPFSYAVRTSATYECPSYGADGNLRKTRTTATAHGTAFGYQRAGQDTLLLTNQHVAEWPPVTDLEHPVEGVATGCKRVSAQLRIVDNDRDSYANDDIPLELVVADPQLDVAILRAHQPLQILPWRVGSSAGIKTRAIVEVKGFPLGALAATNIGKVISALDHDEQGDWNHDDFVVDALLSTGGSGSPVLAISCKTGEFELVGIFHAHYSGASALNVVVGIDQVKDLMKTQKVAVRPKTELKLDAAARARVVKAVGAGDPPFFAYGGLVASVRMRADGALVFVVFGADFPHSSRPMLVVEDLPATEPTQFGTLGAVYVGASTGLAPFAATGADAESQALLARTLEALRTDAIATFDYRDAAPNANGSREAFRKVEQQKRALARMLDGQRDGQQPLADWAAKASKPAEKTVTLGDIETAPAISATVTTTAAPATAGGAMTIR